jgi:hypothetical protein
MIVSFNCITIYTISLKRHIVETLHRLNNNYHHYRPPLPHAPQRTVWLSLKNKVSNHASHWCNLHIIFHIIYLYVSFISWKAIIFNISFHPTVSISYCTIYVLFYSSVAYCFVIFEEKKKKKSSLWQEFPTKGFVQTHCRPRTPLCMSFIWAIFN